jgi:hypothetical protein
MTRMAPSVLRTGAQARDRRQKTFTAGDKLLQQRWMQRYLLTYMQETDIKVVHKQNPYKFYETTSEDTLGFGLGFTVPRMRLNVEVRRGLKEGGAAPRKSKKRKQAASIGEGDNEVEEVVGAGDGEEAGGSIAKEGTVEKTKEGAAKKKKKARNAVVGAAELVLARASENSGAPVSDVGGEGSSEGNAITQ